MRADETPPQRVAPGKLIAFVGPCLPIAALGLPVVVHLPPYYATALGLDLTLAGLIFLLVRLIDIPMDPVIGWGIDKTRTQSGRFRLWLVAGLPLLMLAVWQVFMAQPGVTAFQAFAWLLLLYLAYSVCLLSHTAWASTLSEDYDERSRVYGWWQATNILGMILILLAPLLISGIGDLGVNTVQIMGALIAILLPITVLLAVWRVPEPPSSGAKIKASAHDYWKLVKRPTVARLLGADLLFTFAPGTTSGLFIFFFTYRSGFTLAEAQLLLLVYFVSGFVCGPLWGRLAKRIGKHKALAAAGVFYAVTQTLLVFIPPGNWAVAVPLLILVGAPFAAGPFLLRAMMADVADEERVVTGQDRTGLLYAILVATAKIGYALPVGITYPLLAVIGFQAQSPAANDAGSLLGLALMFTAFPAVISLLGAALVWGFPLDRARHLELKEQLGINPVPDANSIAAAPKPVT